MEFRFNIYAFIIGIVLGIAYMYLMDHEKKKEIVFPTPVNAEKIIYQDEANNCFQFVATKQNCPNDKTKVKQQPIFN